MSIPLMSIPLLKLVAAQRLLAETRDLLDGEALAASLRQQTEVRAQRLCLSPATDANQGIHRILRLDKLVQESQTFGTIYADPPWRYVNLASRGAAENHYATMTIDDIASLPIAKLAAEKSHLHLWTTNAFLFEAQKVIEAWGFTYKSCLMWIKPQLGNGNYWRVSHEFLLLGVRGDLTFTAKNQQSWILADRTEHSTKPAIFRRLIERVSPGPRLELFARNQTEGWTAWGNQIQPDLFDGFEETSPE